MVASADFFPVISLVRTIPTTIFPKSPELSSLFIRGAGVNVGLSYYRISLHEEGKRLLGIILGPPIFGLIIDATGS